MLILVLDHWFQPGTYPCNKYHGSLLQEGDPLEQVIVQKERYGYFEILRELLNKLRLLFNIIVKLELDGPFDILEHFQRQLVCIVNLVQNFQIFIQFLIFLVVVR